MAIENTQPIPTPDHSRTSAEIKEALSVLISKLEGEAKFSSVNQTLKDFQEEFNEGRDKTKLLYFLDEVFKTLISQFPNRLVMSEEDKKIEGVINGFNILCQRYLSDLKN